MATLAVVMPAQVHKPAVTSFAAATASLAPHCDAGLGGWSVIQIRRKDEGPSPVGDSCSSRWELVVFVRQCDFYAEAAKVSNVGGECERR